MNNYLKKLICDPTSPRIFKNNGTWRIGQTELHMMVQSLGFVMHVPNTSSASVFKIISPGVSDSTATEEEHLQ
jgi:hypothetical protein